jgi:hypothetical protein
VLFRFLQPRIIALSIIHDVDFVYMQGNCLHSASTAPSTECMGISFLRWPPKDTDTIAGIAFEDRRMPNYLKVF